MEAKNKMVQNGVILAVVLVVVGLFFAMSGKQSGNTGHSGLSLSLEAMEGEVLFTSNGDIWEFVDSEMLLEEGMQIRTNAGASATLKTPKGTWIRLSENTQLSADKLSKKKMVLSQSSGRSYHRVREASSTDYHVMALGHTVMTEKGVFDVATNADADRINVKALSKASNVMVRESDEKPAVEEGSEITINSDGSFSMAKVNRDYVDSEWFKWNEGEDGKLGFELAIAESIRAMEQEEEAAPATTTAPASTSSSAPKAVSSGSCRPGSSAAKQSAHNAIKLSWNKCENDEFQFYKVVRSVTDSNPTYPGSSVVLSTSNRSVVSYLDKAVVSAKTYYYRVCAVERLGKVTCGNVASLTY